ncbi:type II secretion system F family protein [Stakelama pacifica]|uniref:General secretion pathway protein F n=1 Tax=Stakelama pacifica TaxID=517720 RepID=A0A4R6FF93_9SPHN|nr:type II secretion system F family protein [Stakelama pacifica]TDN79045.1 general secretion pathway protein F [Stakelama pacifica]GGO98765.1 type II secretion system protein GspF [Stakelama pacifica]
MPAFAYKAADRNGANRKGVIEAASPAAARAMLRDQALLPLSVVPATERAAGGGAIRMPLFRRGRISARQLATVTRQIATLVGSEIPIEESLRLVATQSEVPAVTALITEVRGAILDGRSFASALAQHPKAFPEFYRASVAAGEQSGRLPFVLNHLANFVETRQGNSQKLTLALLYPGLLAVVSFGMMVLLMVYVVPDIVKVFVSRGADLPFLTKALIAISAFIRDFGLYAALAGLAAFLIFNRWAARPGNRLRIHRGFSQSRLTRRFSKQFNAARFAGSLATLVESSVPLVEALHAAAAVTPNLYVRNKALHVAARVREGLTLRAAMQEAGVFPSMLVAIVAAGETSGRLGPALGRASNELERELDALVAALVALAEPLVLLVMGGLVLMMVLAILLPIINLNNLVAA